MIKFKKVELEGFGSIIQPLKYKLDRPGLSIIKGRVGSGKTSIIDGFLWVLYGVRTKAKSSVTPWDKVQGKDYRGTKGEVTFTKGADTYKVVRCYNYKGDVQDRKGKSNIFLILNDKIQDQHRDKKQIQKAINEVLGYSADLFKSAVLFGQRANRFMEESGPQRKKIMEEAFEVAYIAKAQKDAQERLAKISTELKLKTQKVELLQETITTCEDSIEEFKKERERQSRENKKRITELKAQMEKVTISTAQKQAIITEIKSCRDSIETLLARIESGPKVADLKPLHDKMFKAEWDYDRHLDKIKDLEAEEDKLRGEYVVVPKKCSECERPFELRDIAKQKQVLKAKIQERKRAIKSLQSDTPKLLGKMQRAKGIYSSKQEEINESNSLNSKIYKLEVSAKNAQMSLDNIKTQRKWVNDWQAQIDELKKAPKVVIPKKLYTKRDKSKSRLQAVKLRLDKIQKDHDLINWAIKGPLSNSGIKAYIFDTMVNDLNKALHAYTHILGFRVVMGVKMGSAHKDFDVTLLRKGEPVPAADMSGGQTQLINLAIILSFNAVITNNKEINALLLDEAFEGLGDEEVDLVADMINRLAMGKSIHLITHRNFAPINSYITTVVLNEKGQTEITNKLANN